MDKASAFLRFVLDNDTVEIDFSKSDSITPSTTVLKYLRSLTGHKGVKEGCSVGDCGACTVVTGELVNDKIHYKAINSCLVLMPSLHGKQLITIENLSRKEGDEILLHPVQYHMLKSHGTQCGYCTPGIVMSLFALYKNVDNPALEDIENALTGNLCRCTGYQPIIDAAKNACAQKSNDHFSENETVIIEKLKEIKRKCNGGIKIIINGSGYFKPSHLRDALKYRREFPEAVIFSGATDLSPAKNRFKTHYTDILDISDVTELKKHSINENGLSVGATLSIEEFKSLTRYTYPALHNILEVFGSLQIRNVATVGGNIASASPIGDLLPPLYVYRAKIELQNFDEKRTLDIADFITGYRKTVLKPDEIITGIFLPEPMGDEMIRCYKVSKRKDLDISTLSAAYKLKLNKNNEIEDIMIVYGGMADVPKRALKTEEYLKEKKWNRDTVNEAMEILYNEFTPISDARSDAEARRLAARNLLLKFWIETSNQ